MYCIIEFCRICFDNKQKLINVHNIDDDIPIFKKFELCFPEIKLQHFKMYTYICEKCTVDLKKNYEFRQLCFKSEIILKCYSQLLNHENSFKHNSSLLELLANNAKELNLSQVEIQASIDPNLQLFDTEIGVELIKMETIHDLNVGEIEMERYEDKEDQIVETEENFECSPRDLLKFECSMDVINETDGIVRDVEGKLIKDAETKVQSPQFNESSAMKKPMQHRCQTCEKEFVNMRHFERHSAKHSQSNTFACVQCENKSFTTQHNLNLHLRRHNADKPFVCHNCDKKFITSNHLKRHELTHIRSEDRDTFPCPICEKGLTTPTHLRRHMLIHTEKSFICKVCNLGFNRWRLLESHELIHSGAKPFVCVECCIGFTTASHLKRHTLIHTGEKSCRQPHGEKRFICDICNKGLATSSHLKRHKLIHAREKS